MSIQAGKKKTTFQDQGWKIEGNFLKRSRTDAEVRVSMKADQDITYLRKKASLKPTRRDKRQLLEVASKANVAGQEVA